MKSLSLSQPHMLIMTGIPGCGKSFFAEKFSDMFHAPYVSYDRVMEVGDNNPELAARYMTYLLHELIKTGHTLVVDGLADTRTQRAELKHLAHTAGYKALFIWVQTDMATAKYRALKPTAQNKRPLSAYEYDQRAGYFVPLTASEKPIVVSGKHTYATQAKIVLKSLASTRQTAQAPTQSAARVSAPPRRNIVIR